jgi:hypothetical protein
LAITRLIFVERDLGAFLSFGVMEQTNLEKLPGNAVVIVDKQRLQEQRSSAPDASDLVAVIRGNTALSWERPIARTACRKQKSIEYGRRCGFAAQIQKAQIGKIMVGAGSKSARAGIGSRISCVIWGYPLVAIPSTE